MFLQCFFRDNYRQQQAKPHPIRKVSFEIVCCVVGYLLQLTTFGKIIFNEHFSGGMFVFDILKCVSRQCQKTVSLKRTGVSYNYCKPVRLKKLLEHSDCDCEFLAELLVCRRYPNIFIYFPSFVYVLKFESLQAFSKFDKCSRNGR